MGGADDESIGDLARPNAGYHVTTAEKRGSVATVGDFREPDRRDKCLFNEGF